MINIRDCLKQMGYSTIPSSFYEKIKSWESWYQGNVKEFHSYQQYNGIKKIKMNRLSLGMAKKICEDKADLLLNEKVEINIGHEATKTVVDEILHNNNFRVMGNQIIELSNALGTGALVELHKNGRIEIDTIEAGCIFPLSWDNDRVAECAFASKINKDGEYYLYLNLHVLEDGLYVIKNRFFKEDKNRSIIDVTEVMDIEPEIHTGSEKPFFQIIKPNIVNNYERDTPMGVSVYANAIDVLKGIDIIYDSYINEFSLGKKRIFLDPSVMQVTVDGESGKLTPTFDVNDVAFYGLSGLQDNKQVIAEINMELRINEHIQGINNNLSLLSSKCGFGKNYYSFENNGLKTATEIVSENSDLFRRIKKDEIVLNKALVDMTEAVIYLANKFLNAGLSENADITINFDDSIIEDKAEIRKQALIEFNAGLIDSAMYFMETREMTEEQALSLVEEINSRRPPEPPPEGEY